MGDILRAGMTWLTGTMKANASQSVVIRRGSKSTTVLATIGRFDAGFASPVNNVSIQRDDLDFIIAVADYGFGGVATEPLASDLIDYNGRRYLVARPDDQTPQAARDEDGLTYRIHTKFRAVI